MAESSKTPKHDFAPAWLKLPSQQSKISKSSSDQHYTSPPGDHKFSAHSSNANKDSTNGGDKRSLRTRRDSGNYRPHDRYDPSLQRQHSFDTYQDSARFNGKLRHHSVDDYYSYQYDSYNGYPEGQYTSQPSLQRQPKYHHPNSRYNKQQVMGMYGPPYYDMYPYDFYSGEPYYGYPSNRTAKTPTRHNTSDTRTDTRTPTRGDKKTTTDKDNHSEPNFNDEFPSLGGQDGSKNTTLTNGGTVWDKPPKKKLNYAENNTTSDPVKDSPNKVASSYKVLIPNKNVLPKKGSLRINGTHTNQDPSLITRTIPKENGVSSPTQPMEILNPRLHTPARLKGDKSNFLKTLRSTCNGSSDDNKSQSPSRDVLTDTVTNGVETLSVDSPASEKLSSSVEAEQRLLREMGWTEDDTEEYVITEAEMQEFHNLSRQVKTQPMNGLIRKTWSPGHMTNALTNETTTTPRTDDLSSSSDSDDSC